MATQIQYEILKTIYDEELQRCSELRNSAKIYLGVCTFFIGGLILKLDKFIANANKLVIAILLTSAIALICTSILLLLALGIYKYEQLCNPRQVIEGFGSGPPSNDEFLDDRLVDIAVACDRNHKQNDRRASFIYVASIILLIGIILSISGVLISTL
jgi:hypothetical protein